MFCRYISFYLTEQGLPIWLAKALTKHQTYFRSAVTFFNHSQRDYCSCESSLALLHMANKPHQFCQLLIEGNDAELAHMVLMALVDQYCIVVPVNQATQTSLGSVMGAHVRVYSLRSIVNKHKALSLIARGSYQSEHVELFEKREAFSATVMGEQIALPHIVSEFVSQPQLTIISLQKPLDWGSTRGDVVCIIGLILPKTDDKTHYRQFAQIARTFTQDIYCRLFVGAPESIKPLMLAVSAV